MIFFSHYVNHIYKVRHIDIAERYWCIFIYITFTQVETVRSGMVCKLVNENNTAKNWKLK